ncbi:MAG: protein kinase [Sandaracinaceae bacterium]
MVALGSKPGGYELVAELGYGGMATLFLARRDGAAGFARFAAVKVVHPHLAKQDRFRRMFVDEAKISAEVVHPNVVRVEDFGEHEGTFFMAMEYVYGCSLADFLHVLARRHNRLIPQVIMHLGAEVAAGLHAAHEAKDRGGRKLELVHRDVSPSNVLLSYDGHVKLIDFGVAKAKFRSQQTEAASLKGKIAYMSPEQANGSEKLDRRTDVYALAVVLWEMLTMRRAFEGANEVQLLKKVQDPKLPPPSRLAPTPKAIDDVIMKALSLDPEERYPTMLAFRRAMLAACPSALEADSNTIADLLAVIMKDHRERQASRIPQSVNEGLDPSLVRRGERSGERIGERLRNLMNEDRTIAGAWVDEDDPLAGIGEDDETEMVLDGPSLMPAMLDDSGQLIGGATISSPGTHPSHPGLLAPGDEASSEVRPIAESPTRMMAPEEATVAAEGEALEAFMPTGPPLPAEPVTGAVGSGVLLTRGRLFVLFAVAAVIGLGVGSVALQVLLRAPATPPDIAAHPLPPVSTEGPKDRETDTLEAVGAQPATIETVLDTPPVGERIQVEPIEMDSGDATDEASDVVADGQVADGQVADGQATDETTTDEPVEAEAPVRRTAAQRRRDARRERIRRRYRARERSRQGGRRAGRRGLPLATGLD